MSKNKINSVEIKPTQGRHRNIEYVISNTPEQKPIYFINRKSPIGIDLDGMQVHFQDGEGNEINTKTTFEGIFKILSSEKPKLFIAAVESQKKSKWLRLAKKHGHEVELARDSYVRKTCALQNRNVADVLYGFLLIGGREAADFFEKQMDEDKKSDLNHRNKNT